MIIKEKDLILPALKIIYDYNFGVDTSTLLNLLRINLKPTGDDLVVLDNRADDKFSQKVRNLKSHKTLENLGFAIYENNKYFITDKGKAEILSLELKENNLDIFQNNKILFTSVSITDLPVRIKNLCNEKNFLYIFELLIFTKNNDLSEIPNLGTGSINELFNFFKKNDLDKIDVYNELSKNNPYEYLKTIALDELKKNLILFTFINEHNFSSRIKNFCKTQNLNYIYELLYLFTNEELKKFPNMGSYSKNAIIDFFQKNNLDKFDVSALISIDPIEFMKEFKIDINNYKKNSYLDTSYIDEFIIMSLDSYNSSKNNERLKKIILSRYGLNGHKRLTLEAAASFYDITRERVRQIQEKFISNLREKSQLIFLLNNLNNKLSSIYYINIDELKKMNLFKYDFNFLYLADLYNDLIIKNNKVGNSYNLLTIESLDNKYFYFKNIKYFDFSKKILKFIGTTGLKKQFTSFMQIENKFPVFCSKINLVEFLENFDELIIDKIKKTVFFYKPNHFITYNIAKISNIIPDKISFDELFLQINRQFKRNIPSKQILIDFLKKGKYVIDDNFLYFKNIKPELLTNLEKSIVNDIKRRQNVFFVEDISDFVIKNEIEYTSSILIYLKYNPLFKSIAKHVYTLAGKNFSQFQIIEMQNKRKIFNQKYKSDYETSWNNNNFKILLTPSAYTITNGKFTIKNSIIDIIGANSEFECTNIDNVQLFTISHGIFINNQIFIKLKVELGDKILITFDTGKKLFSIEKY